MAKEPIVLRFSRGSGRVWLRNLKFCDFLGDAKGPIDLRIFRRSGRVLLRNL